jgi:hypothetical protein
MAANELPAAYRLHAAHCLEIAVQSADSENKVSLLNMAHAWLLLAEQAESQHRRPPPTRSARYLILDSQRQQKFLSRREKKVTIRICYSPLHA